LRVRDDGKGIDRAVLAAQGIEGHYGLRGMPERAALNGRQAGRVERSGRRDRSRAAPSRRHCLRDIPETVVTIADLARRTPARAGGDAS
jgi:hypothetical protein